MNKNIFLDPNLNNLEVKNSKDYINSIDSKDRIESKVYINSKAYIDSKNLINANLQNTEFKTSHKTIIEHINILSKFISLKRKERIFEIIESRTKQITIALEDIYQPHNASATMRTAEALGLLDLHIIENNNKWNKNPEVSLGAEKWLNLIRYNQENKNNSLLCINNLSNQNYKIIATCLKGDTTKQKSIEELKTILEENSKLAIFFGNEEKGLSETVLENANYFLKLPIYGFTQSFNISVSVGIVLNYLIKDLRDKTHNWKLDELEKLILTFQYYKNSYKNWNKLLGGLT